MSTAELYDDQHEQAQLALAFLEHTRNIEFYSGDFDEGDAPKKKNTLSIDEENVKDSALTCLLAYFEKELGTKAPKPLSQLFTGKVKRTKALPLTPASKKRKINQ